MAEGFFFLSNLDVKLLNEALIRAPYNGSASFTGCISHRFRIPIALFQPVRPSVPPGEGDRPHGRVHRLCPFPHKDTHTAPQKHEN